LETKRGEVFSTYGEDKTYVQYSDWKSKRKTQLGKPRRRWGGNIETILREILFELVCWIHLGQDSIDAALINRK
jgi:hypothetical protein